MDQDSAPLVLYLIGLKIMLYEASHYEALSYGALP